MIARFQVYTLPHTRHKVSTDQKSCDRVAFETLTFTAPAAKCLHPVADAALPGYAILIGPK